jgi:transcriptional regulator with XRE-family HTH domain
MATQRTGEHAGRNRISPATLELLIRERNKGKSLRQLGLSFGISHERVRQILIKHRPPRVTLLAENAVANKLGYPIAWLTQLGKEGLVKPTKPGGRWLYTEEQVRQISSLISQMRRCDQCGGLRPLGYRRFRKECSQYRKNTTTGA